jgi:hypothetical protein
LRAADASDSNSTTSGLDHQPPIPNNPATNTATNTATSPAASKAATEVSL